MVVLKQKNTKKIPLSLANYNKLIQEYDRYVDKYINGELKNKQYTSYKKKYDKVSSKLSEEYKLLLDILGDQHLQNKLTETQKATVDIIYPEVKSRISLTDEDKEKELLLLSKMTNGIYPNLLQL